MGTRIMTRAGVLNGILLGAGSYIILVSLLQFALPPINEVPSDFPAVVLWDFRVAAIGMQAVLWGSIGLSFGAMAEHVLRRA